jgi:hypothetical protein
MKLHVPLSSLPPDSSTPLQAPGAARPCADITYTDWAGGETFRG